MYCKKCGNLLEPDDRFCSKCGTRVADEPAQTIDTGFSPMFRQESQESRIDNTETVNKPSKRNFHIEDFNWDLEGYPTEQKKRTEDIDFNWESVLDERDKRTNEDRMFSYREQVKEPVSPFTDEVVKSPFVDEAPATSKESVYENETASVQEEIFSDLEAEGNPDLEKTVRIDKFYTFNKKNAEFQALLDKEYERLKNGLEPEEEELVTTEEILGAAAEEVETEPVIELEVEEPIVMPAEEMAEAVEAIEEAELAHKAEEAIEEAEAEIEAEDEAFVGVAFAETPKGTVAYDEEAAEEEAKEEDKAEAKDSGEGKVWPPSEEKTEESKEESDRKLSFDDIFADDDDDDIEKPKKKHTALKVIAIILCILIVLEVAVICLTHFAPESGITQWIISAFNSIKAIFAGNVPKG